MKKTWQIILIVGIAGILLMAAGFAMNAQLRMTLGRNGFHIGNPPQAADIRESLAPFKDITISLASASVEVIASDKYYIEIIDDNEYAVKYEVHGNKLTVQQDNLWGWNILNFNFSYPHIKVYVPNDASLGDVILELASGTALVDKLNCSSLTTEVASGNMSLTDITAGTLCIDIASGTLNIDGLDSDKLEVSIASGNLDATDVTSNGLELDIASGWAVLSGTFTGENNIALASGSVTLSTKGRKLDYNRSVSALSGGVYMNGQQVWGEETYPGAKSSFDIGLLSGNVDISFSED